MLWKTFMQDPGEQFSVWVKSTDFVGPVVWFDKKAHMFKQLHFQSCLYDNATALYTLVHSDEDGMGS